MAHELRDLGVDLEEEQDAAGFLGVSIKYDPATKTMEMRQEGLIDRCIEALGLDGTSNTATRPSTGQPLPRDADGEPASGEFNYSSIVGMLMYLAGHTRPDIAYAVNCCARYMFCPKRSHEKALKRIGRYLMATRNRGMILDPNKELADILTVNCYPDADFAGMYGHEKPDDPTCVKSRTGFVITFGGCPVIWQSKLQTETALSTMEAEIVGRATRIHEECTTYPLIALVGGAMATESLPSPHRVREGHRDDSATESEPSTAAPDYGYSLSRAMRWDSSVWIDVRIRGRN